MHLGGDLVLIKIGFLPFLYYDIPTTVLTWALVDVSGAELQVRNWHKGDAQATKT